MGRGRSRESRGGGGGGGLVGEEERWRPAALIDDGWWGLRGCCAVGSRRRRGRAKFTILPSCDCWRRRGGGRWGEVMMGVFVRDEDRCQQRASELIPVQKTSGQLCTFALPHKEFFVVIPYFLFINFYFYFVCFGFLFYFFYFTFFIFTFFFHFFFPPFIFYFYIFLLFHKEPRTYCSPTPLPCQVNYRPRGIEHVSPAPSRTPSVLLAYYV